jgi:hypothetical protein
MAPEAKQCIVGPHHSLPAKVLHRPLVPRRPGCASHARRRNHSFCIAGRDGNEMAVHCRLHSTQEASAW